MTDTREYSKGGTGWLVDLVKIPLAHAPWATKTCLTFARQLSPQIESNSHCRLTHKVDLIGAAELVFSNS